MRSWGKSVELWGHTSAGSSRFHGWPQVSLTLLLCLLGVVPPFCFQDNSCKQLWLCLFTVSAVLSSSQTSVVSAAAFEELG